MEASLIPHVAAREGSRRFADVLSAAGATPAPFLSGIFRIERRDLDDIDRTLLAADFLDDRHAVLVLLE